MVQKMGARAGVSSGFPRGACLRMGEKLGAKSLRAIDSATVLGWARAAGSYSPSAVSGKNSCPLVKVPAFRPVCAERRCRSR